MLASETRRCSRTVESRPPENATHHADELVHGAWVAREGTAVAQAAELHVVVFAVALEVYAIGVLGRQVFPVVGPDGFLAILKQVAHLSTLEIRTCVVVLWLHAL